MKKLLFITIAFLFILSCSQSDSLPEPDPKPEPEKETKPDVNFIKYLKGAYPDSVFTLSKYTNVTFRAVYNINANEISSYGFYVWQIVGKKINSKNWVISNKIDLTKRADTLKFQTPLYNYFSEGDSAYMVIQLLRRKSEDTYSILAPDSTIFLISQK